MQATPMTGIGIWGLLLVGFLLISFVVAVLIVVLVLILRKNKGRAQQQLSAPGTGAGLPPPGANIKKIRRSGTSRMISGVCGGFAEYVDKDPLLVRLALVALTLLTGGAAILFYVICWIAIPLGDDSGRQHKSDE